MFCSKCGKEIPNDAMVCQYCGQQLAAVQKIDNHLVEAILVTLFCCLPFGIVSIVYASQVASLVAAGNIDGALDASKKAHRWAMIGMILGIVGSIGWVLVQVLFIGIAAAAD